MTLRCAPQFRQHFDSCSAEMELWMLRHRAEADVLAAVVANTAHLPALKLAGITHVCFDWLPHQIICYVLQDRGEAESVDVMRWCWQTIRLAGYDPEPTIYDVFDLWPDPQHRRQYIAGTAANLNHQAARLRELINACRDAARLYQRSQDIIDRAIGGATEHEFKTRSAGGKTSRAVHNHTVTADIAKNRGLKAVPYSRQPAVA